MRYKGFIFNIRPVQPNFDNLYDELKSKLGQKGSDNMKKVDINVLIALLNQQYKDRELYFEDPFSENAPEWVSKTKQLIAKVDSNLSQAFADATFKYEEIKSMPIQKMGIPELIKNQIKKQILDAKEYLTLSDEKIEEVKMERAYEAGNSYSFLMDIVFIIKQATKEIFIIDAYLDDETFNLFVGNLQNKVEIKILINSTQSKLNKKILDAFKKSNKTISFSIKNSKEIHDRVIFADERCWIMGQSVKNAAEKKPTYIVEIIDVPMMKKIYNDIWDRAISI